MRIPVLSPEGYPLMPAKPSRVRRWLKSGKAKIVKNKLRIFQVQLVVDPSGCKRQECAVGCDPGKLYTGLAVQTASYTLWLGHVFLPFAIIRKRLDQRRMMRRGRRGRRINRKVPYAQRNHRQKRFNNRRSSKLPPSIRASRELEIGLIQKLSFIYPISCVAWEKVVAKGSKGFSPVMQAQYWAIEQLEDYGLEVYKLEGWETSNLRQHLGLAKQKLQKGDAIPETHAVDAVALAASRFVRYWQFKGKRGYWEGSISVTPAPFAIIRRPPISRRQLHLMLPVVGGVRRKYGGTVTRHGLRKGDYVRAEQAGRIYYGWVSGDTAKQVSVSDADWNRLGQFSVKKVRLLQRSTGLIVVPSAGLSNLPLLKGSI